VWNRACSVSLEVIVCGMASVVFFFRGYDCVWDGLCFFCMEMIALGMGSVVFSMEVIVSGIAAVAFRGK